MSTTKTPPNNTFMTPRLFCPGPTPVKASTWRSMNDDTLYHRDSEFSQRLLSCQEQLKPIFGTTQTPLILTCSGTGAMEAAVTNLTSEGDSVVTVVGGKFGERWFNLCQAYGCQTHSFAIDWGTSPDIAELVQRLEQTSAKTLFLQANETSAGVSYPVEQIARAIRAHPKTANTLIIVDAVSALCAQPSQMDLWEIDCMVSGSQKGFGIPPGLGFICLSERAQNSKSSRQRFYFDFERELKSQQRGQTAWTPATTLIAGLESALEHLHQMGLSNVINHHSRLAAATRAGMQALGLELFACSNPSNSLTAARLPERLDGVKLLDTLRITYGSTFAGGQEHLKGKIIRMSHLGMNDILHQSAGLAALEMALKELGHHSEWGQGVGALLKVFHESSK
jgi:serine---pyruvate transaminase